MLNAAHLLRRVRSVVALTCCTAALVAGPSIAGASSIPLQEPTADGAAEADLVELLRAAAAEAGVRDPEISCDGDLEPLREATQTCSLSDGRFRTGVVFENGDEGADPTWTPFLFGDDVAEFVVENFAGQGIDLAGVTCADNLLGEVGTVIVCDVDGVESKIVTVETQGVDGFILDIWMELHPNDRMDGEPGYTQEELEQAAFEGYAPALPGAEGVWTCAGGLDSVEDATQDCTYANKDEVAHVRISVTAIDGDYPVIEEVPFVTADEVAAALEPELAAAGRPGSVTCNSELLGELDNRTECLLEREDGQIAVLDVRVTRVELLEVGFEWTVT